MTAIMQLSSKTGKAMPKPILKTKSCITKAAMFRLRLGQFELGVLPLKLIHAAIFSLPTPIILLNISMLFFLQT